MPRPIITLTTDFGTRDHYVAAMKGVILRDVPDAQIIDITHEIPPQSILAAAFVIAQAIPQFPRDSIHIVVVDPGVGSDRRLSGGSARIRDGAGAGQWRAGITPQSAGAARTAQIVVPQPQGISPTFHGRDVLAPLAGRLGLGMSFDSVGPLVTNPIRLDVSTAAVRPDGSIVGSVIYIDHFGNIITNISCNQLATVAASWEVRMKSTRLGVLHRTYSDVASGELLALIGSAGLLEIAVNGGNAAEKLAVSIGEVVSVSPC